MARLCVCWSIKYSEHILQDRLVIFGGWEEEGGSYVQCLHHSALYTELNKLFVIYMTGERGGGSYVQCLYHSALYTELNKLFVIYMTGERGAHAESHHPRACWRPRSLHCPLRHAHAPVRSLRPGTCMTSCVTPSQINPRACGRPRPLHCPLRHAHAPVRPLRPGTSISCVTWMLCV